MKKLYIACNGDNVGQEIGNAILSDDHQALSGLSKKFKNAHSNIEKWVEKKGGEIVASAGDEIIFAIPEELASQLQGMKDAYSKHSGTTLTMGIGETISQASKALIYGKLNDKNQIVEYEPQIDDYISGEEEGDIPSPEDIDESASEESRTQEGVGQEDEEDQGQGDEDILSEDDDSSDEESSEDFSNQEDYSEEDENDEDLDEDESQEDTEQIDVPKDELDGDYGSEDMEQGQPEHEKDMDEDEEFVHDAQENREDEADDDAIEADEEQNFFGEETDPSSENLDEETDEEDSEDSDIPELSEDDLAFSDEDDQNFNDEDEEESTFEDSLEDEDSLDEDSLEEDGSESDADGFLNEMMHSNVDEGQGEDADSEENTEDIDANQGFEDPENQQLKEKIFSALQSLKQNKEMLDQIQAQNPDLYQGIIANIQSMIEMGKKLGMETEQEEDMDESDLDQNIGTEPYGAYEKEVPVKKPQGSFQA